METICAECQNADKVHIGLWRCKAAPSRDFVSGQHYFLYCTIKNGNGTCKDFAPIVTTLCLHQVPITQCKDCEAGLSS